MCLKKYVQWHFNMIFSIRKVQLHKSKMLIDLFVAAFGGIYSDWLVWVIWLHLSSSFSGFFFFRLISFFALFTLFIAVKYSNEIDKTLTHFEHIRLRTNTFTHFTSLHSNIRFGLFGFFLSFFLPFCLPFVYFRCIQKITFDHHKNKTNGLFTSDSKSHTSALQR